MSLDTNKSNLTRISNSNTHNRHTLFRNYFSPPDTNKHQTEIDNKPKFSLSLPPPPITTVPQPPPPWELESDELPKILFENGSNPNDTRPCSTQKSKINIPLNRLGFIIGSSKVKNVDGYLLTGSQNRKIIVKVRPFSSRKHQI